MAPGLQLSQRLTQSLVLAPQLQQSLALLQAPTLELKALVEQELQQNPVLEEAAPTEHDSNESTNRDGEGPAEAAADPAEPPADFGIGQAFAALRGGFENIQSALDGCCWAGFDFCWCSVVLHRQLSVWAGFIDPSIE